MWHIFHACTLASAPNACTYQLKLDGVPYWAMADALKRGSGPYRSCSAHEIRQPSVLEEFPPPSDFGTGRRGEGITLPGANSSR